MVKGKTEFMDKWPEMSASVILSLKQKLQTLS